MYSLITAYIKPKESFSKWQEAEVGDELFSDLFDKNREIILVLENPFLDNPVSLNAEAIRSRVAGSSFTVSEFLVENGNLTLPTNEAIPNLRTRSVKYFDPFRAGYKVWLTDDSSTIDNQGIDGKLHIKLTREDTDFEFFYKHALVSVNGYIHKTDYDTTGAYVKNCVESLKIAKANHIGLISFENVGQLSFIPITEQMVYKRYSDKPFKEQIDINIGIDVSDKMIALVIGGYLHIGPNNIYRRTGTNTVSIDFNKFGFINRYFESKRALDLSFLNLSSSTVNPDIINIEELNSDETILKYVTNHNSFIILIDSVDLSVEKEYVFKNGKGLQTYGSGIKPIYPLFLGRGLIGDYVYRDEWDGRNRKRWAINVGNNRLDNYLYRTTPIDSLVNIDDARTGAFPKWNCLPAPAYMLKIEKTYIWD